MKRFNEARCNRFLGPETFWRSLFPEGRLDWLVVMEYYQGAKKSKSKVYEKKEVVIWNLLVNFFVDNGIWTTEPERKSGVFKRDKNVFSSNEKKETYYFTESFDAEACLFACKLLYKEKKPQERQGENKNTKNPFCLKQCQGGNWTMKDSANRLGCKGYKWC